MKLGSRAIRLESDAVVHGVLETLLAAEILLSGLDGNMSENKLDLLKLASSLMAEPRPLSILCTPVSCARHLDSKTPSWTLSFSFVPSPSSLSTARARSCDHLWCREMNSYHRSGSEGPLLAVPTYQDRQFYSKQRNHLALMSVV